MHKVTAKHLLEVYKTRLEMQEQGITNPLDYIKIFPVASASILLVQKIKTTREK